jgi:transposase
LTLELPVARVVGLASERSVGRPGPLSRRGSKEAFTISSGVPAVAFNHEMKEHWMSVIIGIDPHKSTHTAVAVDRDEQPVARLTLPARAGQTERLLAWAEPLDTDRVWAIESAAGLGRLLAQQLIAAGERVIDVPPTLSARVRLLSSSRAGKNDTNDALSTAIAGMRHCGLRVVRPDDQLVVLRLLADRHHDLTGLRTQAACRLHVMFRELIPGGARLRVSAAHARRLLDGIEPVDAVSSERHRLAYEHLADIERIDAEIDAVKQRIAAQVAATGSAITELHGVGPVIAAIVLGQVGDIGRFRTRAQFANYNGTAPIEASSANKNRHRVSTRGNRALNHAIHMIAVTQVGHDTPGRAYYLRKQAEGKSRKEALRSLKRRVSDAVWRQLQLDR